MNNREKVEEQFNEILKKAIEQDGDFIRNTIFPAWSNENNRQNKIRFRVWMITEVLFIVLWIVLLLTIVYMPTFDIGIAVQKTLTTRVGIALVVMTFLLVARTPPKG